MTGVYFLAFSLAGPRGIPDRQVGHRTTLNRSRGRASVVPTIVRSPTPNAPRCPLMPTEEAAEAS